METEITLNPLNTGGNSLSLTFSTQWKISFHCYLLIASRLSAKMKKNHLLPHVSNIQHQ